MKFTGYTYPIEKTSKGFFPGTDDVTQIKSDLLILLLTNLGERCLTGDTKIPLANGTESSIKDLVGKDPFWVYSYDEESNSILAGKATAHETIKNASLLTVTLDNDEKIRCTPNHLWLLRDGKTYCRADELKEGMSLMPLYRNLNTSKYERIYQPYLGNYRETHLNFVHEKREKGIREVVHHKDLNKLNNAPDNLQWMTHQGHIDLHKEINNAFLIKFNNDPVFKEEWKKKQKEGLLKYYETHDGSRKGSRLSEEAKQKLSEYRKNFYNTEEGKKAKEHLRKKAIEQFEKNGSSTLGRKHTEEDLKKMRVPRPSICGDNNPSKRLDVKEKLVKAWEIRRLKLNHKVKSIEQIDQREDCYDLHVEKYHNFALSAGVFVHNCMLPEYGTALNQFFFEPNDAVLELQVKNEVIRAISRWEPRVVIEDIEVKAGIDNTYTISSSEIGNDHVLGIRINFRDPDNISQIQELVLNVPLVGR